MTKKVNKRLKLTAKANNSRLCLLNDMIRTDTNTDNIENDNWSWTIRIVGIKNLTLNHVQLIVIPIFFLISQDTSTRLSRPLKLIRKEKFCLWPTGSTGNQHTGNGNTIKKTGRKGNALCFVKSFAIRPELVISSQSIQHELHSPTQKRNQPRHRRSISYTSAPSLIFIASYLIMIEKNIRIEFLQQNCRKMA